MEPGPIILASRSPAMRCGSRATRCKSDRGLPPLLRPGASVYQKISLSAANDRKRRPTRNRSAMSTAPEPAKPAPISEVKVYGHTRLFYWWPIWALSFIFAIITWIDGERMAIVPADSEIVDNKNGTYTITANAGP